MAGESRRLFADDPAPQLFETPDSELKANYARAYEAYQADPATTQYQTAVSQLRNSLFNDPEREARRQRVLETTGQAVLDDDAGTLESTEREAAYRDSLELLRSRGRLAEFFAAPGAAAVAHDDVGALARLSDLYETGIAGFGKGAFALREYTELGQRRLRGETLSPHDMLRLRALEAELGTEYGRGKLADLIAGNTAEISGQMLSMIPSAAATAAVAGGAAALTGPLAPALVPLAAGVGFQSEMARQAYLMESGSAYNEYLDIANSNGETLDPEVARGAAMVTGLINAGLEFLGFSYVARGLGLTQAVNRFVRSGVRQVLVKPTVRAALIGAAKSVAKTWTVETATEVVQEWVQMGGAEIAKAIDSRDFAPLTTDEFIERSADILIKVGTGMLPIAAVGPVTRIHTDIRAAQNAERTEAFFTALGTGVADSKLLQRAPSRFREFVAKATKDGPKESVYVEAARFQEYFQTAGVDINELAEEMPSLKGQMDEFGTGGDLVIPMAEFATTIAPTEHLAALQPHLRLRAEDPSFAESREAVERLQADFRQMSEAATNNLDPVPEAQESAYRLLYTQMRDRLGFDAATSEGYAQFLTAWFETQYGDQAAQKVREQIRFESGIAPTPPTGPSPGAAPATTSGGESFDIGWGTPSLEAMQSMSFDEDVLLPDGATATITRTGDVVYTQSAQRQEALSMLLNCLSS